MNNQIFRKIFSKPPNYYNIRKSISYYSSEKKMQADLFMTFDQFKEQLGSWAKPLEYFTNGKTFQKIYNYVKA